MTQCDQILSWLRRRKGLTTWQAIQAFRCTRLSGRILDLRKRGHNIDSEFVRTKNGKRIVVYRLVH